MYTFSANTKIKSAEANSNNTENMPWTQNLDPWIHSVGSSAFSTIVIDTGAIHNGYRRSTGAQNAYVEYNAAFSPGTWTVGIMTVTDVDRGIYTVSLDGTVVGTMDGYSGSNVKNVELATSGFVVATGGKKVLRLTMATKNASSSNYYGYLQTLITKRTS